MVPNGEGKHPAKLINAFFAVFFPGMQNDFGVRLSTKPVASLDELLSKFDKVVDFAVEDNPSRFIFVGHRLATAGKINNAQAIEGKTDVAPAQLPVVIRSTMPRDLAHTIEQRLFYSMFFIEIE